MKKLMVFQSYIEGHLLEYLNHLYNNAIFETVFVIPNNKELLQLKEWENRGLSSFRFLNNIEIRKSWESAFGKVYILKKIISELKPTDVLLLTNHDYQPWLPFIFAKNVNIHSLVYYTPYYEWGEIGIWRRLKKSLIFKNQILSKQIKTLFVCNDNQVTHFYNEKMKTNKFVCFPDPIPFNYTYQKPSKIEHVKVTFLHIGALSKRKGTLNILDAMAQISDNYRKKIKLIVAGKVDSSIRLLFYEKLYKLKDEMDIEVHDEFCDFEAIKKFCLKSDFLLMPYLSCNQSSGMFGYASLFNIPVVATNKGFFKQIVKRESLGYTIDDESASSIKSFIESVLKNNCLDINVSSDYADNHTIECFVKTIYNRIIKLA